MAYPPCELHKEMGALPKNPQQDHHFVGKDAFVAFAHDVDGGDGDGHGNGMRGNVRHFPAALDLLQIN
jgi:hypothetical protein